MALDSTRGEKVILVPRWIARSKIPSGRAWPSNSTNPDVDSRLGDSVPSESAIGSKGRKAGIERRGTARISPRGSDKNLYRIQSEGLEGGRFFDKDRPRLFSGGRSMKRIAAVLITMLMVRGAAADQRKAEPQNDPQQIFRDLEQGQQPKGYVRDEAANLKVEDMTMDELRQRLAEFEAGKRDDRDGYIIANQLWFNYQGRQEAGTAAAQRVKQVREDLLRKHPNFGNLQDFRLSDKVRYQENKKQEQARARQEASRWTPPDTTPVRILGSGNRAVAVYQYRIDFLKLPADVQLKQKGSRLRIFRQNQEIAPSSLAAEKKMTFKHPIETLPAWPDSVATGFLACSTILYDLYHAMTPEEEMVIRALGRGRSMPWVSRSGATDQFCGVLSLKGDVMFSFGDQTMPGKLFHPLGISDDGKKAAVMVGEKVRERSEEGQRWVVGNPRSVLVWKDGVGLKTVPITDKTQTRVTLLRKFAAGEF